MRFERSTWPNPRRTRRPPPSPRRLAAAQRAVRREHDEVALFPELVRYQTPEDRLQAQEQNSDAYAHRIRAHDARTWRRARRELRALPHITQRGLLRYWHQASMPKSASYFADLIHQVRTRHVSPWHLLADLRRFVLIGQGKLKAPWTK